MPIDSGKLRHPVTLRGVTTVSDGEGGQTESVAVLHSNVWAEVSPIQGFEKLEAMQTDQNVTHRVRVRYAEVTNPHAVKSILHEGRTLEVVAAPINDGERDELLTFMASEAT